jgi:5-methylcytosine-specific restriction endonuclease McrA
MTYSEKLKDPRWQKKRLEILSAANFACEYCTNKTKTLHVHHLSYLKGKDPWDYTDDYLVCLCEDCHAISHSKSIPVFAQELFCLFAYYEDKEPIMALIYFLKLYKYV